MSRFLVAWAVLGLGLAGLADAQTAPPADSKDVPSKIDMSKVTFKKDTEFSLVPAPSEIVATVRKGNYGTKLATYIEVRKHDYSGPSWKAALALGASFSDLVLGIDNLPAEKIAAGLDDLKTGMTALRLPPSRVQEVEALRADLIAKKLEKEQLVQKFDQLRADLLQHGKFELGTQNFGLVLVGGWARGANLATQVAETYPAALHDLEILKERPVIDTFIQLVGTGNDVKAVQASLKDILAITANRPNGLTDNDASVIRRATHDILAQI
jgi:hypothetical protein